jgi:hypothetical protein
MLKRDPPQLPRNFSVREFTYNEPVMRQLAIIVTSLLLVGCARYEYDIARPEEFAGHVGTKSDHTFAREPLEYELRTVDNRLVMRIHNNTGDSIRLLGEQSSVVDPEGQSHPLRTLTIVPSSFVQVILPPPRPRVYGSGSSIGFGIGTTVGHRHHPYPYSILHDEYEPRYFSVYDDADTFYWDWKGQGEARLMLVFQRNEEKFTHEFVIRRVKM